MSTEENSDMNDEDHESSSHSVVPNLEEQKEDIHQTKLTDYNFVRKVYEKQRVFWVVNKIFNNDDHKILPAYTHSFLFSSKQRALDFIKEEKVRMIDEYIDEAYEENELTPQEYLSITFEEANQGEYCEKVTFQLNPVYLNQEFVYQPPQN